MKVFLTGGTGFIGGEVARQLRARGDEVSCLVRTPGERQDACRARLRAGRRRSRRRPRPCAPGWRAATPSSTPPRCTRSGSPPSSTRRCTRPTCAGTEQVMHAALEAKVAEVVYVSTVGAFGNTHRKVVDETYEHPGKEFTSYYEETKLEGHRVAKRMIVDQSLPCDHRPARGRLRPWRHLAGGRPARAVLRRQAAAAALPRAGDMPDPRRGHRRRHPARSRQGQARRDLRAQRPGDDDARRDRDRCQRQRSQGAEARPADRSDEGDDADRAAASAR